LFGFLISSKISFQSTLPCGERRHFATCLEFHFPDFNPRSPAGSDTETNPFVPSAIPISIHAPLRGATFLPIPNATYTPISIHAPLRGATPVYLLPGNNFLISIHAPLRGATKCGGLVINHSGISIHAPLRGATFWKR